MSYILDALRRSEQERLRGQPLSTLGHAPVAAAADDRPRWLMPLLAGNLVVLTMLGVWWLRSLASEPSVAAPPPAAAVAPPPAVPAAPVIAPPPAAATPPTTTIAPPEEFAPEVSNAQYENAGDWAADTGAPELHLSTHVYSSEAGARIVVIDGVRLREGERHPNGLRVLEITPTGARVNYRGETTELELGR